MGNDHTVKEQRQPLMFSNCSTSIKTAAINKAIVDSRLHPDAQLTVSTSGLYRSAKFGWNLCRYMYYYAEAAETFIKCRQKTTKYYNTKRVFFKLAEHYFAMRNTVFNKLHLNMLFDNIYTSINRRNTVFRYY